MMRRTSSVGWTLSRTYRDTSPTMGASHCQWMVIARRMSSRRGSGCCSDAAVVLQSVLRSRLIPADRVARLMVIGALHVGLAIYDYFTESKPPPPQQGKR